MRSEQVLGGRYRLTDPIGVGGMSIVWLAHDDVLNRDVAVKILASRFAADQTFRDAVRAEAQAAAGLSHPHVTSVYDYGEFNDGDGQLVPFIVMELLRGQSLADRLRAGPLDPGHAVRVCAQVAAALAAAHAHGVVHRDVKPGNIMLGPSGVKVFDFGIAAPSGQRVATGPGVPLLGTATYVAPERLTGSAVLPASDVYALGVLLFRLLAGTPPWPARTTEELVHAHLHVEPRPLPAGSGVLGEVADLVQRCLAKNPGQRPAARDVAVALALAAGVRPVIEDDLEEARDADHVAQAGVRPPGADRRPRPFLAATVVDLAAPESDPAPARAARARLGRHRIVVGLSIAVIAVTVAAWSVTRGQESLAGAGGLGGPSSGDQPGASSGRTQTGPGSSLSPPASAGVRPVGLEPWPPAGPDPDGGTGTRTGAGTPSASPTPTASPVDSTGWVTFTSDGGSVVAQCQDQLAYLVSWQPAPGFAVDRVERGPAIHAKVSFGDGLVLVTITVRCASGLPKASIRTSS